MKPKILFICVHNSARSQMAEALMNATCPDHFIAESAGLEPGELNPYAVEVMREIGIDMSQKSTKAVFDLFKAGKLYSHVIAVCDTEAAERCPVFPGLVERHQWSFPDPSAATGSHEERLAVAREVRDMIKAAVEKWCSERCAAV
ncbi:MAG: arsenate reductase ArsC [Verrucomicrobiaceae bacterium]|nr:MAG: arsenate reductase ArsC [Verrucomicrobiaceae bacterium]